MRKPMRPEMHPELRPDVRPEMRPPMRPPMRPLTDEDGEVRELTAEDFKGMRPLREADPGLIEAVAEYRRKRGRPKSPAPKIYIGLRMSPDVVESVKASGAGYNARVEQALRKAGIRRPEHQPSEEGRGPRPYGEDGHALGAPGALGGQQGPSRALERGRRRAPRQTRR